MSPFLWLELCSAFWSAFLPPPRDLPASVTDIREGHAIRARRAEQRRRL
ncbi:hypothetical protein [Methylobacterium sp. SD21]